MSKLFELVRDHIEAFDEVTQEWETAEGNKTLTRSFARPVAWIERVHERGVLTALDCLSIIFFALNDWHALSTQQEIQLAEGWAAELRHAADAGEIQARDPFTLLPLKSIPEGWDWGLSIIDADRFLAARGMSWRCGEIATHIYNEVSGDIDAKRFPVEFYPKPTTQATQAEPQAVPVADSADDGDAWKAKARERAGEIIKRQRAKDLYPSQEDIADEIAREFRTGGVMGAGGKPLTGAYIKRHALKGISSAQNRQLSTSIRRGK